MSEEIATLKEKVSRIFNKLNQEKIEGLRVTEENIKACHREIIDIYRDEKKFNALKVYELTGTNVLDPDAIQEKVLTLDLKQDFLLNENVDDYSVFLHTDGDPRVCKISFAGFTTFEQKEIDESNSVTFIPYKRFNVFKVSMFKNLDTGKSYVFLKFNNRRRYRNQINFFNIETDFFKRWLSENLGYRLKLVEVKDIYAKHTYDKTKFEDSGYNVSDILDDRDETLPVDLKFRPNDRNLKAEDIYTHVNKVVFSSFEEKLTNACESAFGKIDQESRDKFIFELKTLNLSKLFFESAHRAFENGVGHIKYLEKVEDYDKPIVFRFDFPADEAGVIKVEILDSGKYMKIIYDEINKYLSKR